MDFHFWKANKNALNKATSNWDGTSEPEYNARYIVKRQGEFLNEWFFFIANVLKNIYTLSENLHHVIWFFSVSEVQNLFDRINFH